MQRIAKTGKIFHTETLQNFTQLSFIVSFLNQTSCFISKRFSSTTALRYFKKKAMAGMTPVILLDEDDEPMVTEPIYLLSDESEYSTPNTTPVHHHESIYPDSINQQVASQLEQRPNMGTETVFCPPTPNTSMISDDKEQSNLTPIIGHPGQYTSQMAQRRNPPKRFCQHL